MTRDSAGRAAPRDSARGDGQRRSRRGVRAGPRGSRPWSRPSSDSSRSSRSGFLRAPATVFRSFSLAARARARCPPGIRRAASSPSRSSFPLSGVGDRAFGGADAIAWPVAPLRGLRGGMDVPVPLRLREHPRPLASRRDAARPLRVWVVATIAAIARGRTLWAILHGLGLRAVNVEGLLDVGRDPRQRALALGPGLGRRVLLHPPALGRRRCASARSGRRSPAAGFRARARSRRRLGLPPGETSAFWKLTGRLSGGAIDPNALGLLSGLAFVAAVAWLLAAGRRRALDRARRGLRRGPRALGIAERSARSSRSAWSPSSCAPGLPAARRLRFAVGLAAAAGVLVLAALLLQADRGGLARRLAALHGSGALRLRTGPRRGPLLWAGAVRLFGKHPIAGAGLGAFSWQLPNLLAEEGRALPVRDNPGSAYLQALAETGAIGFLLVAVFAFLLAREAVRGAFGVEGEAARGRVRRGGARVPRRPRLRVALVRAGRVAGLLPLRRLRGADRRPRRHFARRGRGPDPARGRPPLRRRGGVRDARDAFAGRGLPLPSGDGVSRQGGGPRRFVLLDRAPLRDPAAARTRLCASRLAHYTPEGRPVELTAEADGKVVLSKTLAPGQGLPLRLSAGPTAAAGVPLHALPLVRAQAPGSSRRTAASSASSPCSRGAERGPGPAVEFQFHPSSGSGAVRSSKLSDRGQKAVDPRRPGWRRSSRSRCGSPCPAVAMRALRGQALGRARRAIPPRRRAAFAVAEGRVRRAWPARARDAASLCRSDRLPLSASRRRPGPRRSTPRRACSRPARRRTPPRACRGSSSRSSGGSPSCSRRRPPIRASRPATPSILPLATELFEPAVVFGPRVSPWTGAEEFFTGLELATPAGSAVRRAGRRHRRLRRTRAAEAWTRVSGGTATSSSSPHGGGQATLFGHLAKIEVRARTEAFGAASGSARSARPAGSCRRRCTTSSGGSATARWRRPTPGSPCSTGASARRTCRSRRWRRPRPPGRWSRCPSARKSSRSSKVQTTRGIRPSGFILPPWAFDLPFGSLGAACALCLVLRRVASR